MPVVVVAVVPVVVVAVVPVVVVAVFESVDVYLKTGDKNYIIKSISGTIF